MRAVQMEFAMPPASPMGTLRQPGLGGHVLPVRDPHLHARLLYSDDRNN